MALAELPLGDLPRRARHASHGVVRIIGYHGDGKFTVLTRDDRRVLAHREQLTFLRERNGIGKRANWYRELADPKVIATVAHPARHPQAWALGGAGAVGAAGRRSPDRNRRTASDAAVGALAGQTAFQAAGYAPSHYARHKVGWNTRMSQISDPAERARHKAEDKARKASIRAHTDASGHIDWTAHYRSFPAEHRYSRVFRTVGRTHRGRTGMVLGAAATTAGATAGAHHGRREMVGKAAEYGVRQTRVRPLRAAETAAGFGGLAYGASRSPLIGRAVVRGIKLATRHGGAEQTRQALVAAEQIGGGIRAGTRPLEQVRRIGYVNHLVELVPKPLRPDVAAAAGALLAYHAHPVRGSKFTAVEGP